jgi:predicted transcriptional regulator
VIFSVAKSWTVEEFTTYALEKNLDVSGNTARSILNGLVNLKLFEKKKLGRRWVYRMINRDHLIETWNL